MTSTERSPLRIIATKPPLRIAYRESHRLLNKGLPGTHKGAEHYHGESVRGHKPRRSTPDSDLG
jgi:hypothetical protein